MKVKLNIDGGVELFKLIDLIRLLKEKRRLYYVININILCIVMKFIMESFV